jgi:quinoprotein glucose dehydrogenase
MIPLLLLAVAQYTGWSDYGGSADSMQYSALRQINKQNVAKLEQVFFHPAPGPSGRFAFSPLVVGDRMFVVGKDNAVVALDAGTGKLLWTHPVEGQPTNRGFNYWHSKDNRDRRLIFAANSYLQEINIDTGVTINSFGMDGRVNLREGLGRDPKSIRNIQSGTPGKVFENLIILGSSTGEMYNDPPGDLRAYDVLTGKLVWQFHTIPHPGELGYDTWPPDAWKTAGGVNAWGEISIDTDRGIAYFPLGSPTYDLYGADRIGANLYGDCLLALDARTGKRLWHRQLIHHDLWDYDPNTAPKLLTIKQNGKAVDIVAQPTKFGLLYVFNRVTGEPIWPIEERPVPQSDMPGEKSSATQPFPVKPPPFSRLHFTEKDINPYLDQAEQQRLREFMRNARNDGLFTPPGFKDLIQAPGQLGGSNWGGTAGDPATGFLYVRAVDMPSTTKLSERRATGGVFGQFCSGCHGNAPPKVPFERLRHVVRNGEGQMPAFSEDTINDAQLRTIAEMPPLPPVSEDGPKRYFGAFGSIWLAGNGLPAISPPWAELLAYNLNEGTIAWRVPLGTVTSLAKQGITQTGSYRPTRNGPVVTAGGLVFIATASDRFVRAYDKDNGKVLWERQIPSNPDGLPAVYDVNGRQYVAFYAGSGRSYTGIAWDAGKPEAQGYYVFALPKP